jgi:hypothetical protein
MQAFAPKIKANLTESGDSGSGEKPCHEWHE